VLIEMQPGPDAGGRPEGVEQLRSRCAYRRALNERLGVGAAMSGSAAIGICVHAG
jgi:hypothetical protein